MVLAEQVLNPSLVESNVEKSAYDAAAVAELSAVRKTAKYSACWTSTHIIWSYLRHKMFRGFHQTSSDVSNEEWVMLL